MNAHPHDLKARAELDEAAFMAGVALFDDMLREADRRARADDDAEYAGACIWACVRDGAPLSLYALPMLQRLLAQPESMPGFAAALGDYIGDLQVGMAPGTGAVYERLQFDDVWTDRTASPLAPSNVVRFVPRAGVAA
jgi:hypothetical protein